MKREHAIFINNNKMVGIDLELQKLRDSSKYLPPILKGPAIMNNKAIRTAHNKFARPKTAVAADEPKGGDRDNKVYYFINFIPIQDSLYELDGLKGGLIKLEERGDNDQDWLRMVQPLI